MWRPKDWIGNIPAVRTKQDELCKIAFEAGADAMLEALKKDGVYSTGDAPVLGYGKGWAIFIPDKE